MEPTRVIDLSLNNDIVWPLPSGMDFDRMAELHEAGELDGVIVRGHRYGPVNDVRAVGYIKELGLRGVPVALYGNYSPWWSPSYGEKLANLAGSKFVTGIEKGGHTFRVIAAGEIGRSGYSKQAYSDGWFAYATAAGADMIYGSWNTHNNNVGGADNSWMGSFKKWVANYTSGPSPLLPADWEDYDLWQWSADGNGMGQYYGVYSPAVDLNRWHPRYDVVEPPAELTLEERVGRLEQAVFG